MSTEVSTVEEAPAAPPRSRRLLHLLENYALALLLVAVVIFFSVWPKTGDIYIQADNFRNLFSNQVVLAIVALGSIVPLICGQFDLSVGAVALLSSVLAAASYAHWHVPLLVGILIGVAIGALVGLVNGLIVTLFGVNALITTLGTASVITGFVTWYTGGGSIVDGIPTALTSFGSPSTTVVGIPPVLFLLVVAALLVWYLLEHTPFGRYLHAVGTNPAAAELVGMRIPALVRRAFITSGAAAGLAGVVLLAQAGAGNGNTTVQASLTLNALAAAFLGATSVRPGRFNVLGTLFAIYFLAAAVTGLTFAGAEGWISDLFNGAALVFAVAISTMLRRRRAG
jgi:ribose transport system permease protein